MVSQHALQVSRLTPRGEVEGSGLGGLQAHIRGEVEGSSLRGYPGPHPVGVSRSTPGGLQAHTEEYPSMH